MDTSSCRVVSSPLKTRLDYFVSKFEFTRPQFNFFIYAIADVLFPEPAEIPRDSSFVAFDTIHAHASAHQTRNASPRVASSSHRHSSYEVQQHQQQQQQRSNGVTSSSLAVQASSPYASSQLSVELRRNSSSVSDAGRAQVFES